MRRLTLRRDSLAELTTGELTSVHGGAAPTDAGLVCVLAGPTAVRCALSLSTCIDTCQE